MLFTYQKKMNASKEKIFAIIRDNSLSDFPKKNIKEGYVGSKYETTKPNRMGKEVKISVHISKYEENKLYEVVTQTENDTYTSTYTIDDTPNGTILKYVENYKSELQLNNLNYLLMRILYNFSSKRRIKHIFKSIEGIALNS